MYSYSKYGTRDLKPREKAAEKKEPKREQKKEDKEEKPKEEARTFENEYSNNHIHTHHFPTSYIRNVSNPIEGYPKSRRLKELKKAQIAHYATTPFGCRVEPKDMVRTLNRWIAQNLQFDVIMIGALVENQFQESFLKELPLHRLCAKPGFLFVWAETKTIPALNAIINGDKWNKKFRRSEELAFVPVDDDSPYFPLGVNDGSYYPAESSGNGESLFQRKQWHCWMCITGTVRRLSDADLIHCNIDTDLQIEQKKEVNAVPDTMYRVAENFSNSVRRLHIIPTRSGARLPVRARPGWVIMLPDVLIDNFDAGRYEAELAAKLVVKKVGRQLQYLVGQTPEIELLRPKTPT